ncbi:MAG TPA: LapA family protein [Bacteroidia bacterium]|nr:LapA family protein [Bacteroidia bacterium]
MKFTIIAVVIALLAVIFALQNAQPVMVKLFFWDFSSSMALLMLITLVIGIASGMMTLFPAIYRRNSAIKSHSKKIKELEKQLSDFTSKKYS